MLFLLTKCCYPAEGRGNPYICGGSRRDHLQKKNFYCMQHTFTAPYKVMGRAHRCRELRSKTRRLREATYGIPPNQRRRLRRSDPVQPAAAANQSFFWPSIDELAFDKAESCKVTSAGESTVQACSVQNLWVSSGSITRRFLFVYNDFDPPRGLGHRHWSLFQSGRLVATISLYSFIPT